MIHIEPFKDNMCLIGMSCAAAWFRRVRLQKQPPEVFLKKAVLQNPQNSQENTCAGVSYPTFLFVPWWRNIVGMDPSINFRGLFAVK